MKILLSTVLGASLGYALDSMGHSMLTPEYWIIMGLVFALILTTALDW